MSAKEWDASRHLWLMLHNAEQLTGDQRKMGLFGVACCRRHASLLLPESQAVLDEFEALLDRLSRPTSAEVCRAGEPLGDRANGAVGLVLPVDPKTDRWRLAAAKAVCYAAVGDPWGAYGYFTELDAREEAHQVHVLRDIFGNPFRPVFLNPDWRTEAVLALAGAMYEDRDFSAMPILADALEDAGCDDPEILHHCRRSDPHQRGCWVLDCLLNKVAKTSSTLAGRQQLLEEPKSEARRPWWKFWG
jgi:hypothetical protein